MSDENVRVLVQTTGQTPVLLDIPDDEEGLEEFLEYVINEVTLAQRNPETAGVLMKLPNSNAYVTPCHIVSVTPS